MLFSSLAAAIALCSFSGAFLLPPTLSAADVAMVNALPFEVAITGDGQVMEADCPGCPVDIIDILGRVNAVTTQIESHLRLDFSIAHSQGPDKLMLNGIQLYPLDPYSTNLQTLVADQLVKSPQGKFEYAASPSLGFGLSIRPVIFSSDEQISLVEVQLEVLEVGGKFVDGIKYVELKLLETPSGKLMIGDAQLRSPVLVGDGHACTNIICKWRATVGAKLSKLKGCAGKRPQHKSSHGRHGRHGRPYGAHPQGAHSHGGHRHHHRRHSGFARFIRGVVFHVLVPILIGFVVGFTASLVGMVVGHLAIFVWRALFRRGQRTEYQKGRACEADIGDESESFLHHESPPPVYEDAPAYEEAVVDEKGAQ